MKELTEDAAARGPDGVCVVCHAPANEDHNQRTHDLYWRAEEATW